MMFLSYLGWAGVLFAQNYSFTYVSRARNSGSLLRHFKAAIFSNGIWIVSNMLMLGPMFDYLTGKHGFELQVITGSVYTVATVAGSLVAHAVAKHTEKGLNAVGASVKYVQITPEQWATLQADSARALELAGQAYACGVDKLPTAVVAAKVGGAVVVS